MIRNEPPEEKELDISEIRYQIILMFNDEAHKYRKPERPWDIESIKAARVRTDKLEAMVEYLLESTSDADMQSFWEEFQ